MFFNLLCWTAVLAIAFLAGKLMSKIKMPSILGWLIVGILLAAIVDLGAPLDYHLILGAGLYTFIYIAAAAVIIEFIAIIAAKKGFELAAEIQKR